MTISWLFWDKKGKSTPSHVNHRLPEFLFQRIHSSEHGVALVGTRKKRQIRLRFVDEIGEPHAKQAQGNGSVVCRKEETARGAEHIRVVVRRLDCLAAGERGEIRMSDFYL